ncbi:MAG: hypothetical protein IPF98_04105 [Gemmatimonadetes bacterium]|nr:hypothetical protein [Gemmatimonadota bacterium]MCC6773518.1 hypothetical protein [Gemmatimonadaceae bacterium]
MTARPRLAAFVSPVLATLVFWILLAGMEPRLARNPFVGNGRVGSFVLLVLISLPMAYSGAALFAFPFYLVLKRLGWLTRVSVVLLGAAYGLVVATAAFSFREIMRTPTLGALAVVAGGVGGIWYAFFGMAGGHSPET